MVLPKKQLLPQKADLKSCLVEIIPAVAEKNIPETLRITLAGSIQYGETEAVLDFQMPVTEQIAVSVLSVALQESLQDLISLARNILLEKYVLK